MLSLICSAPYLAFFARPSLLIHPPPKWLAHETLKVHMQGGAPQRRIKASELKRQLEAAGVSTAGIVEKEELERLVEELNKAGGGAEADGDSSLTSLPITYMMDGAYAQVDEFRLLIDTGSAISIVSSAAGAKLGLAPDGTRDHTLNSRDGSVVLPGFGVAAPQQQLPPGVDGILGIDCMREFAAVEFDWEAPCLRLHSQPWERESASGAEPSSASITMPLTMQRVSAGELPFVTAAFGSRSDETKRCQVEGLVDTGSPVTMVTPELAKAASMLIGTGNANDDVMTTGVDGQPTRMQASRCEVIELGAPTGQRVAHVDATVYTGTCPMMQMVGWQGTAAALLGLDVLRGGVQGGKPKAAAAGGPAKGRLVLDISRSELVVME